MRRELKWLITIGVLAIVGAGVMFVLLEDRGPVLHFDVAQVTERSSNSLRADRLSFAVGSPVTRTVVLSTELQPVCSGEDQVQNANVTLTLPDGRIVRNRAGSPSERIAEARIHSFTFTVTRQDLKQLAATDRNVTLSIPVVGSCGAHIIDFELRVRAT